MKTDKLNFIKTFIDSNRLQVLTILLSLIVTAIWSNSSNQNTPIESESADPSSLDTLIPVGFSLVNIEIVNSDKLDAILGQFGVVDLFLANEDGNRTSKRIATKVKILRAPKNPQEFAVLVPDSQVAELFSYNSPFYASIQNPNPSDANSISNFAKRTLRVSRITSE